MTMGKSWSFMPDDTYKPTRELIHTLVDVVAKGGNLLLNVGPQPDGRLPAEANKRMDEIGDWMAVNAEAIHGTRPVIPYRAGNVGFTAKGKNTYALVLNEPVPRMLLPKFRPAPGTRATLLGSGTTVKMRATAEGTVVELPGDVVSVPPCRHAHVFKFA
jgi:alpha-L-fucosidase